jgi:uncharacterized protein (TIGR03083 family)
VQASVLLQQRLAAIRHDLADAQRRLLETLDHVESDGWSLRSPTNPGWTIHELLTHLTTAESSFVPSLERMASGKGGVPDDFDPNRWNAGQLRRRAEAYQSPEQLRVELEGAHAAMLTLLDSLDQTALDQRGRLSSGVDGSTEDCFRLVASHKRAHTQDIAGALGDR